MKREKEGLKINIRKPKEMKIISTNSSSIILKYEVIEPVLIFNIVTKQEGADEGVAQRFRKAKGVFAQLTPIWKSEDLRLRTKIKY